MSVLTGLAALALLLGALAFVVLWRRREQRLWEERVARMKFPCIHRFVRVVFVAGADGKVKERYPQCMDCGERVLTHIKFTEED